MGSRSVFMRPGIWTPPSGRKRPQWPFAVDLDNPLAGHLIAYYPMLPFGEQDGQIELVQRNTGTLTRADIPKVGSASFSWVADDMFGHLPDFPSGSSASSTPRYEYSAKTMITDPPLTVIAWGFPTQSTLGSNDITLWQNSNNGATSAYQRADIDNGAGNKGKLRVFSDGESVRTGNLFDLNEWNHTACVYGLASPASASPWRAILNGDVNNAAESTTTPPANVNEFTIGWENDSTPGDGWEGLLADIYIFDTDLSDAEVQSHYQDPFQLIATRKRFYSFPSAAVGGLSIPVAMHEYRQRHQSVV